jgi:polyisoprenoid-binding protein YceI
MTAAITTDTALQVPRIGRYRIDPATSAVTFSTRHLFGLAPVKGSLEIREGTMEVAEPVGSSTVRVTLDAGSFDTGNPQRDRNVRSARFLDADRYPTMGFTADRLERDGDGWALLGTLRVREVERPVRLAIRRSTAPARQPSRFAVEAGVRIDRVRFSLVASRGMAGRHLDVSLRTEWVAR